MKAEESDAVVILADENVKTYVEAIYAVMDRAKAAKESVREKTRRALSNGYSEYMRPFLEQSAMYPETDVSPVAVPTDLVITSKRICLRDSMIGCVAMGHEFS